MGELETKLGELLKLERERQQRRLEDIAEGLRISEDRLKAIERGDLEALPSEVYFGLFAKSYAETLGIDYSATVEAIKEDIAGTPEEPKRPKKGKPGEAPPGGEVSAEGAEEAGEAEAPPKASRLRVALYAAAAVVILVGGYLVIDQLVADMSADTRLPGQPGESAGDGPVGEDAMFANYDWNVPDYEPADSLRLRLTARGESWATILADGDTAVFRNLLPGRIYDVTAGHRITMSVAVPRVVDIELNGRRIEPVSPETGRIARVNITQVNVDSFLNYKPPVQDETEVPVQRDQAATRPSAETTAPAPAEPVQDTLGANSDGR